MARSAKEFLNALKALLPPGDAFPKEEGKAPNRDAVLMVLAEEFAGLDQVFEQVVLEANPRSINHTLVNWEAAKGLPECSNHAPATRQERVAAVVEKDQRTGSWNLHAIKALAASIGYDITIIEHRPFIAGLSRCGHRLDGPAICRYWLRIVIAGARVTAFRTGQSAAAEKLLTISRAGDLECLIASRKPGHQKIAYDYDGV